MVGNGKGNGIGLVVSAVVYALGGSKPILIKPFCSIVQSFSQSRSAFEYTKISKSPEKCEILFFNGFLRKWPLTIVFCAS